MRALAVLGTIACTGAASAHVMQHLFWFKIQREIRIQPGKMIAIHEARFSPDLFRGDDPLMDTDADSTASEHEIADFCQKAAEYIAVDFIVLFGDLPCPTASDSIQVFPDQSGFRTQVSIELPDLPTTGPVPIRVLDPSYLFLTPADAASSSTVVETSGPIALVNLRNEHVAKLQLPKSFNTTLQLAAETSAPLQLSHPPQDPTPAP